MRNRKRLAHDVTCTSATHASFVNDITDFFKMAVLTAMFSRLFETVISNIVDLLLTKKLLCVSVCCFVFFHSC